jgi:putative membrane protein
VTALAAVKALHMLALLALLWSSLRKNMLLTPVNLTAANALRTRQFDKLSAASAGIMLLTGLAMALWVAKPFAYYAGHPAFWLKIAVFIVASGLIVWSKVFIRKATTQATSPVPAAVRWVLRIDFAGLLLMAALGFVIAHGL